MNVVPLHTPTIVCPCCKQEVPPSAAMDYRAALFFEGNYDTFSAHERIVADTLANAAGRTVEKDHLIQNIWLDHDEPKDPDEGIKIIVYKLRKKLGGRVKIETVWGLGYRMVLVDGI